MESKNKKKRAAVKGLSLNDIFFIVDYFIFMNMLLFLDNTSRKRLFEDAAYDDDVTEFFIKNEKPTAIVDLVSDSDGDSAQSKKPRKQKSTVYILLF